MNPYLVFVLAALALRVGLQAAADWLNVRHLELTLPGEFAGFYDAERYARSQAYLRDTTWFGMVEDAVETGLELLLILGGGFYLIDRAARTAGLPPVLTGLVFTGILFVGLRILKTGFAAYHTFGIEARYGFNRTTPRTFVLDLLKTLLLAALLGGPVLAAVFWFFERFPAMAWLYAWAFLAVFQVGLVFAAPYVILPLFNKFTPLEDGELARAIRAYASDRGFRVKGIFTMDGSRRSAKSNAFFTGFGRSRRIVLFDTLIERHTVPEVVAIVAHELGHCRLRHVPQAVVRSLVLALGTFALLGLFMKNERLFAAFGFPPGYASTYGSLVLFAFLYAPLALVLSAVENAISRHHEYAADRYAIDTCGEPEALVLALKKLSVDNFSNLTPHPLKVVLGYSHPPMLQRIAAIRRRLPSPATPVPPHQGPVR